MSLSNVELVQDMCDAFLGGDFERALAVLDPDVEWLGTVGGLDEGRVARGHGEVVKAFGENLEAWESHELEAQRLIDAGDRVVVFWHEEGQGRSSGARVTTDTAVVYTVRGGRVVHVRGYLNRGEALEAVGLEG